MREFVEAEADQEGGMFVESEAGVCDEHCFSDGLLFVGGE